MKTKNVFIAMIMSLLFVTNSFAHDLPHNLVTVNFKITEADTKKITPIMMCIQNAETKEVVTPPYGKVVKEFSTVDDFVSGIMFSSDKNWIGPVRKTTGKGGDLTRSFIYDTAQPVPFWKAPALYQASGDFSINLKPGKWILNISHGYEYIPVLMQEFIVPADDHEFDINISLKRWINLPKMGWYSGDVHVHHPTTKPEYRQYLISFAKAENLHIVNTLNMGYHHYDGDSKTGVDYEQQGFGKKFRTQDGKYCLISGQEDPRSTYGHIIGLNLSEFSRDTAHYDYYDNVFKDIHKQPGALVGFAHLAFNGCEILRGLPWYITTNEIDFVELLQLTKINTYGYYDYLNLGFRLSAAAGSDFPYGATMGEVRTYVYTGKKFHVDKWFEGLKNGNTFVSNGPALFFTANDKIPGNDVIVNHGSTAKLKVTAISPKEIGQMTRLAIYNNDGLVHEILNPKATDTLQFNFDLPITKSQWLVAAVYCNNDAVAHTSPIYFVVDGKPTWNIEKAPEIICKQMKFIDEIELVTTEPGILTRLKNARVFYRKMLDEMQVPEMKYETFAQKLAANKQSKPLQIEKVLVEGGEFMMGDPLNFGDQPVHKVKVSSFEISKYEVTNYQFAEFMNAKKVNFRATLNDKSLVLAFGPFTKLEYVNEKWQAKKGYDNYPVINLTWYGGTEFCKWIGGRLPTEAEWEFAAKGGVKSQNYLYAGSNDITEVAWFGYNSIYHPNEVGQLKPNELGIYDMSGNVGEWCSDWYETYQNGYQINPKGPEKGEMHIFRGGSYHEVESSCRNTHRSCYIPEIGFNFVGFRVAF